MYGTDDTIMILDVDLQKHLGDFQLDATFRIEGKRIGLFGPSGHGKSTLINLLAGLLTADRGHIQLNGQPVYHSDSRVNQSPKKRHIAVVFQHAHLFPHYSVKGNLLYGYNRLKSGQHKLQPDEVIDALDIGKLLDRQVTSLSGGERQRVALGRALLASPRLLILDEPLSALDHSLKGQIIPYLRKTLSRFDIPYLYISHSLSEMRLLTDQVVILNQGRVDTVTTAEEMALQRMASDHRGYVNHLQLTNPREQGTLLGYRWGKKELYLTDRNGHHEGLFELSSKEILLFKDNPGAVSARNLFEMTITDIKPIGHSVAVTLGNEPNMLISQVMHEAAHELNLKVGGRVFVAIKASVFRPLA
jgi:molybdate transport system ATP-binding protein